MKRAVVCGVIVFGSLVCRAFANPDISVSEILPPHGMIRGEDPTGKWFAICPNYSAYELKQVYLSSAAASMYDDDYTYFMKGTDCPDPMIFLRNIDGLKMHALPSGTISSTSPTSARAHFGNKEISINAIWENKESGGGKLYDLVLVDSKFRQTLVLGCWTTDEPQWDLLWIGDLDGDGKIDLLIYSDKEADKDTYRLFLSSKAKPGEAVGELADYQTPGD